MACLFARAAAGAHAAPGEGVPATVARRVALVLIAVLLGAALYLANASGLMHNALPMPFGWGLATVESGSMEPTFSKGDLLVVRACEGGEAAVGDVVVYASDSGSLVVHRLVARAPGELTTQGDANDTPDAPVAPSQVLAVVAACVPGLGAAVDALKTPVGITAMLAIALLLVELPFRRHREHADDERRRLQAEIDELRARQATPAGDDWREW